MFEDRIVSEDEFALEEFIKYVENLDALAKEQKDIIQNYKEILSTDKKLYFMFGDLIGVLVGFIYRKFDNYTIEGLKKVEEDIKDYKKQLISTMKKFEEINKAENSQISGAIYIFKALIDLVTLIEDYAMMEYVRLVSMLMGEAEKKIYPMFNDNISKIISNAKIIKVKTISGNIPDSWIKVNGEEIPVEIKAGKFNQKALEQLQRYMKVYKTNKGIAVGEKLTTVLPDNITFVSIEQLKEVGEK